MVNGQRKSFLCPNCRKLISLDEPHCPYCGLPNPGSKWKNNPWTRGFGNPVQLIRTIVYINAGMFVLSLLMNPLSTGLTLNPFQFLSPDTTSLVALGASGAKPIDLLHRWWSLVSAIYLHGSILHILFNMLALNQIGRFTVEEYGTYRTFVIYTVSGVVGYWVSYLAGIPITLGASGALCGLIGAGLYYGKSRGGVYGQVVYQQIRGWVIGIFLFGFLVPGIDNWAHGAGLVSGILLGLLLGYNEKRREGFLDKTMAGVCALVTAAVLLLAVASGVYYLLS
ncbi:MAG: rhomboid family intramembrane serine protease [Syntrophobacteraceae bacterium]|nr:rhomboid family intramembrane serine protease [Desulfobacteraceae bacterium]